MLDINNKIEENADTDYPVVRLYLDLDSLDLSLHHSYPHSGTPMPVWNKKALLLGPNLAGTNGDNIKAVCQTFMSVIVKIAEAAIARDDDSVACACHDLEGYLHDEIIYGALYTDNEGEAV